MGFSPCCSSIGASLTNDKVADLFLDVRPIARATGPLSGIAMVGGPWPFIDGLYKTMFDRIVVDVIHMPLEIGFIADLVLPEPPLPYPTLSPVRPGLGLGQFPGAFSQIPMGEAGLDAGPST